MKIKTYASRDMRSALRQVRDEQGPDAVILATRHFDDGVEVTVAIEPEAALAVQLHASTAPAAPVAAAAGSEFADLMARTASATATPAAAPSVDASLGEELRTMRHLLERQLSQLAWNDLTRRAPDTAELLKELTAMGVSSDLSAELLRELPDGIGMVDAQRRVLAMLTRRIATTGDELLDKGGRILFVGPTGVGKTTGIAKLAARWVMRHGTRDIALVSLDDQRFGAQEQMRVLGRLLGVECFSLENPAALPGLLGRLPRHRLVLIDTAGMSAGHRDFAARAPALDRVARDGLWNVLMSI
jgi:flagellar biosynthesis protein FlhF